MKNSAAIALLIFLASVSSCMKNKPIVKMIAPTTSHVSGNFSNYPEGWLYLENVLSGKEDSVFVKDGKFSMDVANGHGSFYYYLSDENNQLLLFLPPGDSLFIQGKTLEDEIKELQFTGSAAPFNKYLEFLVAYLNNRSKKLDTIYQHASFDSLMAFNQREASWLKSKLNEFTKNINSANNTLFVKLEEMRIEWMHKNDMCGFPLWYFSIKKEPFKDEKKIETAFQNENLNDTLLLWINQATDALTCYFSNEYFRLSREWRMAQPQKNYFLKDYWNYAFDKFGAIPSMKLLVPYFLYQDIVFRVEKNSLQAANTYFSFHPQENYKNKHLKNVISLINQIKTGEPAPDFKFTDLLDTNKVYHLSDFRGKNLIIEFGSTYCAGCLQAAQSVRDKYSNIQNKSELVYMYVLVEEASDRVKTFALNNKFPFPVHRVADGSVKDVHNKYALFVEPRFVWIDKQGNLKDPFFYQPWHPDFWSTIEKL